MRPARLRVKSRKSAGRPAAVHALGRSEAVPQASVKPGNGRSPRFSEISAQKKSIIRLQQSTPESEDDVQTKGGMAIRFVARHGFAGSASQLPHGRQIQHSFGRHDISGIQAYINRPATDANRQMGAQAYTAGGKVAFRAYPDLRLAAHEAAHVVQQRKGIQLKDGIGRSGDIYERHADAVADKVSRGEKAEGLLNRIPNNVRPAAVAALQMWKQTSDVGIAESWTAYVNPGKAGGKGNRNQGRQARSFQRLSGRSVKEEGGKSIVEIDSGKFDKREISGRSDATEFADYEGAMEMDGQWTVDVDEYVLFDGQPQTTDVIQGNIGDCFMLAVLMSLAGTAAGRAHLANIIKASGDKYLVDFFRLIIAGGRALTDPKKKIRVKVSRKRSENQGAQFREISRNHTPDELEKFKKVYSIPAGSKVEGKRTKYVVWPWVMEKAYAMVVGSYGKIDGGVSEIPMMAITGETPEYIGGIDGFNAVAVSALFTDMQNSLANSKPVKAGTQKPKLPALSSDCTVTQADAAQGVKVVGSNDPTESGWVPWKDFFSQTISFAIEDNDKSETRLADELDGDKDKVLAEVNNPVVNQSVKCSMDILYGNGLWIAESHAYSVQNVAVSATLLNPWGNFHPRPISRAEFPQLFFSVERIS